MKMSTILGLLLILTSGIADSSFAQSCGVPYAERDQPAIRGLLVGPIANSNPRGVGGALLRMHELAVLSATGSYSTTQRMALNNEYLAWMLEIDRIGQTGNLGRFRPRSRIWLDNVIDPAYLGIAGTIIAGKTVAEAQANAAVAARQTAEAIQAMWSCY